MFILKSIDSRKLCLYSSQSVECELEGTYPQNHMTRKDDLENLIITGHIEGRNNRQKQQTTYFMIRAKRVRTPWRAITEHEFVGRYSSAEIKRSSKDPNAAWN